MQRVFSFLAAPTLLFMKYIPSIVLALFVSFALLFAAGKNEYTPMGIGQSTLDLFTSMLSTKQDASTNLTSWSALPATKQSLGLRAQIGVTSEDGSNTNTFETACASVPAIFVQTFNQVIAITNTVTAVTKSNCVVNLGASGVTYYLLAVERDTP